MGFGVEELSQVTAEKTFGTSLEGQFQGGKDDEVPSMYRTRGHCYRPLLPPMSVAPRPDICVLPGVQIKAEVWARALMTIFYDDDGGVNLNSLLGAAKILFDSLITGNEVRVRIARRTILYRHRCKAIQVALSWMKKNKVNGVDPYAFSEHQGTLTPEEVEKIHKLIFREGQLP